MHVERDGDVWIVRMDDGENRFNRASIDAWHAALDQVESTEGPMALVTTGTGKFYSNGLDLDWLATASDDHGFIDDVYRVWGRFLALDCYTVAAVNGHAFAGGAMLASAHDLLLMREDRGWWCVPEAHLGLPLTDVMMGVLDTHVPKVTLASAAMTGHRYAGAEAVAAGIAAEALPEPALLSTAVARAQEMTSVTRSVLAAHKRLLWGDLLDACGVGAEAAGP